MKAITTRSGVAYEGPSIPTNPSPKKVVERETEETTDKEQTNFQGKKLYEKSNAQMMKFLEIFQKIHFDISFADALLYMPKFAPMFRSLISNKEKLFELSSAPLNENCSAVLLKKLPKKLETRARIDDEDFDPEGDICLIKNLLNTDPFQLPAIDLKQVEVTKAKSSIEDPPKLELKDLPSHLEYAYLEGNDKLHVIIAKSLKDDEK
ncbi:hypothetical protein Tco_1311552 [Tanacetum coccineum]